MAPGPPGHDHDPGEPQSITQIAALLGTAAASGVDRSRHLLNPETAPNSTDQQFRGLVLGLAEGHLFGHLDAEGPQSVGRVGNPHSRERRYEDAEEHHTRVSYRVGCLGAAQAPRSVDKVRLSRQERAHHGGQVLPIELAVGVESGDEGGAPPAGQPVAQA
jgi:hypothetical protein